MAENLKSHRGGIWKGILSSFPYPLSECVLLLPEGRNHLLITPLQVFFWGNIISVASQSSYYEQLRGYILRGPLESLQCPHWHRGISLPSLSHLYYLKFCLHCQVFFFRFVWALVQSCPDSNWGTDPDPKSLSHLTYTLSHIWSELSSLFFRLSNMICGICVHHVMWYLSPFDEVAPTAVHLWSPQG